MLCEFAPITSNDFYEPSYHDRYFFQPEGMSNNLYLSFSRSPFVSFLDLSQI